MSGSLFLADETATTALGGHLAALLRPGDVVTLSGDLGAGKTSLARAILRALAGDPGLEVPSPTFSLVQPYAFQGRPVLHADLYRIGSAVELEELGLFEEPNAIVLIEWPDRAPQLYAQAEVAVALAVPSDGTGRTATVDFRDGRSLPNA